MPKGSNNKKKNHSVVDLHKKEIMNGIRNTEDIDVVLKYTHDEDNDIRLEAVKQLCPCKVLRDVEVFWDRVF